MVIQTEDKTPGKLRLLQVLHIVLLALILAAILFLLSDDVKTGFLSLEFESSINSIEILFVIVPLICLFLGIFAPWISKKTSWFQRRAGIYMNHLNRISNFGAMAIITFMLAIMGGRMQIWLSLFILSAIALIFTFPTSKEKLEKQWASVKTKNND